MRPTMNGQKYVIVASNNLKVIGISNEYPYFFGWGEGLFNQTQYALPSIIELQ